MLEIISVENAPLSLTHHVKDGSYYPSSGGRDDPINEGDDPFGDHVYNMRCNVKSPRLLTQRQGDTIKAANSPRCCYRGGGEHRFKSLVLTDKSTNNPILSKSITTTEMAFDFAAGVTVPQLPKFHTPPYPKIYPKRKPSLSLKDTLLNVEVAHPTRPRKSRPVVPSLDHQDFPTIHLFSNIRKPGYKNHFRSHSRISESGIERLYHGSPRLLGVCDPGMNDSIGTTSPAWFCNRTYNTLGGTNYETEKTLGVSHLATGYDHQEPKNEPLKLKNMIDLVVQKHQGQRIQKWRIPECSVCNPVDISEIVSSTWDVVSLRNFLEDPFSIPEGYKLNRYIRTGKNKRCFVELHCAEESIHRHKDSRKSPAQGNSTRNPMAQCMEEV